MARITKSKNRFLNIYLFEDPFFVELAVEHKILPMYLDSMCDNIGVYQHSLKLMEFHTGLSLSSDELEQIINAQAEKLERIDDNVFIIKDFLKRQHCTRGALLPTSPVFNSYIRDLRNSGLSQWFAKYQPECVSFETVIFIEAFEKGILEPKVYSKSSSKRSAELDNKTPFQFYYEKAVRELSTMPIQWDNYGISKALLSSKGIGVGTGKEKRADKGGEVEVGSSTGSVKGLNTDEAVTYLSAKELLSSLSIAGSGSEHEGVTKIFSLLKGGIKPEDITNHIRELEEHFPKSEITIDSIVEHFQK